LAFLLLLCGILFFYRLGERSLSSSHEARAAQNAVSILRDGAWALPHLLNGRVEMQKPPLYYWLVALCAQWDGEVDARAVRMPAAISALAGVLALWFWGWHRGRPLAGFLAASILATCVHFTWLSRVGRIDMPLTLAISLALLGFLLGTNAQREKPATRAWPWFLVGYLGTAAGLLLKGPIAAVLPVLALIVFHFIEWAWFRDPENASGQERASRPWSTLWWGVPLALAIAAPWFIWAQIRTGGELFQVFFWYHNVERGLGGSETLQARPWWFYGPRFFVDLLPWSLVLLLAVVLVRKQPWWRIDRECRFGATWLLTMLAFLSLMRFKRADYLLPAYPGAALWLACLLERLMKDRASIPSRVAMSRGLNYGLGTVLAGCIAGWSIYLTMVEPDQERRRCYTRFAAEIRGRTPDQVIFFRTEAHELVFQVGRPLDTILEWENLDVWASRPEIYVVMPPECAAVWPQRLRAGRLEKVLCTSDLSAKTPERPLVLLRSIPKID
jgi:4-amino-4-deoxy-L-arabinose transferase-like glycosyltransferase